MDTSGFELDVDTTDFILSTVHQKEDLIDRWWWQQCSFSILWSISNCIITDSVGNSFHSISIKSHNKWTRYICILKNDWKLSIVVILMALIKNKMEKDKIQITFADVHGMENPAIFPRILKLSSQTWGFATHLMGRNQHCKSLNQVPKKVKPKLVISHNDMTFSANPRIYEKG